jgi:hypothetical protein
MIVAMLALFVALTGTAVATTSALITGKQIKNSSITGLDVKNRSLRPIDFRGSVRGPRGLRGLTGATGATGATGPPGAPNPNADTLDGLDSGAFALASMAGRVARNNVAGVALNNGADGAYVTELSTSLAAAGSPGLALVQANISAYDFNEAACPCQIEIRIRNVTTGISGPTSFVWIGGTPDEDSLGMGAGGVSAVFPIPAGATHQYDFQAVVDDTNATASAYIDMSAVYIPFNATGGTTLAGGVTGRSGGESTP